MVSASTLPRAEPYSRAGGALRTRAFVWGVAALAVVARLPFVHVPAGPDEAGFLQVAHQWAPGGGSLYGGYWVDRPPVLITLFQVADAAGGVGALRLLGCLAVVVGVVLSARTAELVAGPRAARWAAVVAAALLVSPLTGSREVNGELLAVPFLAAGLLAAVAASRAPHPTGAVLLAAAAGAAGTGAVLVKQNLVDVFVFAAALWVGERWSGGLSRGRVRRLAVGILAGAGLAAAVVAAWTAAHGTSLLGVLDAMYPFRIRAAQALSAGGSAYASERAGGLTVSWVASGMALLMGALVLAHRRWRGDPVVVALAVTIGYAAVSVALGGGYWTHYLVELAVPLAVAAGVLAARGVRASAYMAAAATVSSALAVGVAVLQLPDHSTSHTIGAAVGEVSRPGDTLTTLYGDPEINLAAGLPSPYEHLWSLPVKTLDPRLTTLDAVLTGPDAPTWVVVKRSVASWGLDSTHTAAIIATDYHRVAEYAGQTVYLRDGVLRPAPDLGATP